MSKYFVCQLTGRKTIEQCRKCWQNLKGTVTYRSRAECKIENERK